MEDIFISDHCKSDTFFHENQGFSVAFVLAFVSFESLWWTFNVYFGFNPIFRRFMHLFLMILNDTWITISASQFQNKNG